MILDGIDLTEFSAGLSAGDLHRDRFRDVPSACGVYVVICGAGTLPRFRQKSTAGWFKKLDPSCSLPDVRGAWVSNARILYVGMAAGAKGLKQRIRQLVDFGFGKPVGHRGGRMLWHLPDHESLEIRWHQCPRSRADRLETQLIGQFRAVHGSRPFANRVK